MEKIRTYLKNPWIMAGIALVIGFAIGLFVFGWGLTPVKWVDASPQDLRADLKIDYMRMAVQSYKLYKNADDAQRRWAELGDEADTVLAQVSLEPGKLTQKDVETFGAIARGSAPVVAEPVEGEPTKAATETETKASPNLTMLLAVLCVILVVVGGALVYVFFIRKRKPTAAEPEAMPMDDLAQAAPRQADYAAQGQDQPVAQFMTTYMAGDDQYDDSFSIDAPNGDFLGECGVGIAETIGVGDPKKVTAFEVWLFDKNDIQTVTKVLMSSHAFEDLAIKQRLESKGEPVLAEPGKGVLLETATLQLQARVVDMSYGQGALPAGSFFDRLTIELAVWPKS